MMRIEKATPKQVRYACKFFHYAKRTPQPIHSYSIYNKGVWCGVIVFGYGANPRIARPYNLWQGQVMELVRVALNGKQSCTSQALAMALKRLKKDNPQIKIIVSYADKDQNHKGIIYQATNWLYMGEFTAGTKKILINGKDVHKRSIVSRHGCCKLDVLKKMYKNDLQLEISKGKHKYLFFFDKKLKKQYLKDALPYPKE